MVPVARSVWECYKETDDRPYVPERFTALQAFEWTAAPDGNNLHRDIIFLGQALDAPTSWFEDRTVEELWDWMEAGGGGAENFLAIPTRSGKGFQKRVASKPVARNRHALSRHSQNRHPGCQGLFRGFNRMGCSVSSCRIMARLLGRVIQN